MYAALKNKNTKAAYNRSNLKYIHTDTKHKTHKCSVIKTSIIKILEITLIKAF